MDFSRLSVMSDGNIRGAFHANLVDDLDEADTIALTLAKWIPDKPLTFRHHMGGKPRDLIGTTWAVLKLVSSRFVDLLESNNVTGWTRFDVVVHDKRGEEIKGYHGFAVKGRCGPIDKSRYRLEVRPSPIGKMEETLVGFYFDLNTWDGSDIFVPAETCARIVVKRVRKLIESAKIANVRFTGLDERERLILDSDRDEPWFPKSPSDQDT